MKLSFPLTSKPSPTEKPRPPNDFIDDEDENQTETPPDTEFITEFTSSNSLTPTHQPNLIISPLQNTWKPHAHTHNQIPNYPNLTTSFESLSTSPTDRETSYGLNLRPKKPISNVDEKLLQKFREDIRKLPDDKGVEEFVDVPVEGYGKAVLAGYGWSEGKGIGKNAKEDVKVVQYEGRIGRHGLGFVPKTED